MDSSSRDRTAVLARHLLVAGASLLLSAAARSAPDRVSIRVGINEYKPLVFTNAEGKLDGLFIDVLREIGRKEKWDLQYVRGERSQCLRRLDRGQIDLLVAVGYSKEKAERYDFTKDALWNNWAEIYTTQDLGVQAFLDLEGKTIAVVKGDAFVDELARLVRGFGVSCETVEAVDYHAVFREIEDGRVDAGLISRLFGVLHGHEYRVEKAPIVLCPIELRFAAPKGKNASVISALNKHIAEQKKRKDSVYHTSLNKWLHPRVVIEGGQWAKWLALVVSCLLVLSLAVGSAMMMRSHRALKKSSHALRVLSECNRVSSRAHDEAGLAQDVCETIVQTGGYRMAWVGYAEDDEAKTVQPVAHAGCPSGYLEATPVTWADTERGRSPTGTAIRTAAPQLTEDIRSEPDDEPWHTAAIEQGYASSIALPLTAQGHTLGALTIYASEPNAFDDAEAELLEELGNDLAFGIVALRRHAEREEMELRLLESQQMELMGRLVSGVAHEVRNPLNAIVSVSEALFDEIGDNEEYAPYMKHIRTQVDRLTALMTDLLQYGRAPQLELMRQPLVEVCRAVLSLWDDSPFSKTHSVKLAEPPGSEQLEIHADSAKLQQVLLNLLDNAAQHSPEGSAIQLTVCEPEGDQARIEVVDAGSGIPPEVLPRVFEPFVSKRKGGTGLGLSIVKRIVESHGGEVAIRNNEPPPGCTVEVSLPLAGSSAAGT